MEKFKFSLLLFVVCCSGKVTSGNFLYFQPGYEYQYKFQSDAHVDNLDSFTIAAKIAYSNIAETPNDQELHLKVSHLSFVSGTGKETGNVLQNWDLSKWFSFNITRQGQILSVYHDPREDEEALAIKKGLASLLASRLHGEHEEEIVKSHPDGWTYDVTELGHEGQHDATYVVSQNSAGDHVFTKTRSGHPLEHAEANYTKDWGNIYEINANVNNPLGCEGELTLEYSKDTGVVHTVRIKEGINAMGKKEGFNPREGLGSTQPDSDFEPNNMPEMKAMATGHMKFLSHHKLSKLPKKPAFDLTQGSIHVTDPKPSVPAVDIEKVLGFVKSNLTCMRWREGKGSSKHTACFRKLRDALAILPDTEMEKLAKDYLPPQPMLKHYSRDRLSMLDALSDLQTEASQKIVTDLVLLGKEPEREMAERFLLHVAGMEDIPSKYVTQTLSSIVFHPENYPALLEYPSTLQRATLALGAVTNIMWRNGADAEAQEVAAQLQGLLGIHDEYAYRQRRSTMSEAEALEEEARKVTLLEALGNAGLDMSYDHIVSHVNSTNSQWVKRAGLHALRAYGHDHAANVILMTALYDEHDTVRYDAGRHYIKHPKAQLSRLISSDSQDNFKSDDNTTEVASHSRVRRSSPNEALTFKVKSPSVDWTKLVGSEDIGASFGITIKNGLDFETGLLDGKMAVDLYDEAFARVNMGFLNANLDVLKAHLCFKGKADYNLNMLQEYDPREMQRLTQLYDDLKENATDSIKNSMTAFRAIIDSGTNLGDTVKTFVDNLNALPDKVLHLGDDVVTDLQILGELDTEEMPTFVGPLWRLANKVISLYNDIRNDVMGFYMRLLRTTIVLPFGSKQVFNSISDIVDTMVDFNSDPKTAMATVTGNTVTIGLQVEAMMEALQDANEAAFFLRKTKPYWWNMKQQKDELDIMATEATEALNNAGAAWVSSVGYDEVNEFSEGRKTLTSLRQEVMDSLTAIPGNIIVPFGDVADLGDDLQKSFTDVIDLVYNIKDAYEDLRVGVKTAEEMINRVFGPKVHKDFPQTLRVPSGPCAGNGLYESVLDYGGPEYDHKGVDLLITVGDNVVAPFSGYIMRSRASSTELILDVTGGLLEDIRVYINNVRPSETILYPDDEDYQPNHVAAGDVLGVSVRSRCNNHLHFSMLKEHRGYIDPTKYLEPRVATTPSWIQQCDDYRFIYKGQTVSAGSIVGLSGRLNNDTSPVRTGPTVTNPTAVSSANDPSTQVDTLILNSGNLSKKIKDKGTEAEIAATRSSDSTLQKLMSKADIFLDNMNPKNLKIGSLAVFLNTLSFQTSFNRLNSVFQKIQELMNSRTCLNPYQMADDHLRSELRVQGKVSTGTRAELVERFVAREDRCMTLSLGLQQNMYCQVDQQCMGVECCLGVKLFMIRKNYRFYTRYDPCSMELVVGIDDVYERRIGPDLDMDDIYGGFHDLTLDTGVTISSLNAELMLKMSLEKSDTQITLSASAGFCREGDIVGINCLLFLDILDKAVMPLPVCGPAPDRKLTFRRVNLMSELRNQKDKFSEDSKSTISALVDSVVSEVTNLVPCMSADENSGSKLPCPRPDKMTEANLIQVLGSRGLDTSGSKNQLINRLEEADRTCQVGGQDYSIPIISNSTLAEKVYLTLADNCLSFEACVDFEYQDFQLSVRSTMELDSCTPLLTTTFQDCTQEMILFSDNLNTTGELRLTDNFIVNFQVQQDLPESEYIFDLGLKLQIDPAGSPILDDFVIENMRVPIPTCASTNYQLPTSVGTFDSLASNFGGSLTTDMVDYMFKMLHLDTVLSDTCTVPAGAGCPSNISVSTYLPSDYDDQVRCVMATDCLGISCCMEWSMAFPKVPFDVIKNVSFLITFDPCNDMLLTVNFGGYHHSERLLDYDFGTVKALSIGKGENTGDPAPVTIQFKVDRLFQTNPYDEAFLVDAHVNMNIPMDGTTYSFPTGGLTLMQRERFEICEAADLSDLANFDLTDFTTNLGESPSDTLTPGTVQMIINHFGLTPLLKKTQCDIAKDPYIPNLRGWRDDCDMAIFNQPPSLGDNAVCHMSSSCSRVDCCFYSPLLDMSFNAFFDLNVCDYYIEGGIENRAYPRLYLLNQTEEINWDLGVNGTFEISNAILLEYNVRKEDPNFIVDVIIKLCLGNDCQYQLGVFRDTRIPQLDCEADMTQSLKDVSFQFWKWEECVLDTPSTGCQIALPGGSSQTCVLTDNCKTVQCCEAADLVVARKSLEFTFTSDVCGDAFSFSLEEKSWTKSLSGVVGISNSKVIIQEHVGDAMTLTLGIQEELSGLTVDATLEICSTRSGVTSCTNHTMMSDVQIYDPAASCSVGRRKRSVSDMTRDQQMLQLISQNATTSDIETYFEQLETVEESRCSQLRSNESSTESLMSPKAILEAMGSKNPATVLYCNDDSILSSNVEGAAEILAQMTTATDVVGRAGLMYIPGNGLTKKGLLTLSHKIADLTLGELNAFVMSFEGTEPELVVELLEDMRQLIYALYSDGLASVQGGGVTDQFTSFDLTFDGTYSLAPTDATFMKRAKFFLVGGLMPMRFRFTTTISYGTDISLSSKVMNMKSSGTVAPYANLQASGALSVGVVMAGTLTLSGTICNVKFPSKAEISFDKFPLDVELSMDLELIPLELKLTADVSVQISLSAETVDKTLFSSNIWYYRTPSIRKRVLDEERKEEDSSSPVFITAENTGANTIVEVIHCQVRQLPSYDYTDPRVEVLVDVSDDRSTVKLTLDIGTQLGLSDVKQGYEMGGPQIIITEQLSPTGVPLYFQVNAENREGKTSFVTCSLPSYDVTLPNGRFSSEFKSSSNAHIVKGSAVIYEDSELRSSRIAVGLGRNIYSDSMLSYTDVNFTARTTLPYDPSTDPMGETALADHFTGQKIGRLVVSVDFVTDELVNIASPGECAKKCLELSDTKCMSFNYDSNGDCQLLEAIETQDNALSHDGLHRHYERLGFGLAEEFNFDLELTHNTMYYMVLHLTNILGFEKLLSTEGTLVDLTPPEPGSIVIQSDTYNITDCESNLPEDRRDDWKIWCVGIDSTLANHRTIVDGPGSMTLFNGHEPLVDLQYTKANTYISANWDGIHDYESGILGYSFAVGTSLCGEDIHPHHDPYKHLTPIDDDSQWTGIGMVELPEGKKLPDGRYYVTVRAINQVEYGGPLVTTICHSTPLAIDNTPPIIYDIYNIKYDDVSYNLTADFNATDPESGIQTIYMCLGLNIINCDLIGWTETPSLNEIVINYQIPDGQRAWVRLRVVNNVDLQVDAAAEFALIVDNSGPETGTVYDGDVLGEDLTYSNQDDIFCANWDGFYDPQSSIAYYQGFVIDDTQAMISNITEFTSQEQSACFNFPAGTLQHNHRYKFRLTAVNNGHKQLNVTVDSDGVIIDTTDPTTGQVIDGQNGGFSDQVYSISTSTVSAQWRNFDDAESNIDNYAVKVTRSANLGAGIEEVIQDFDATDNYTSTVEYTHFNLRHGDVVKTTLKVTNGAQSSIESQTNGVVIDLTPPDMTTLFDGSGGSDIKYTSTQGSLSGKFTFQDLESGIASFKFQVYQTYQGSRHQFYPSSSNTWHSGSSNSITSITLSGFSMTGGAHYSIRVAATNNAGAIATYDTDGVIFDDSAPTMGATVKVGAFGSENEEVIGGYVHQSDLNGIKASWSATDSESGVEYYEIAVGTSSYGTNVLNWRNVGRKTDVYIDGLSLSITSGSSPIYYVSVRATNGAGMTSSTRASRGVKTVQDDRPGSVTDGPLNTHDLSLAGIEDIDFQKDKTTVTAQFNGFSSHLHGIVRFDWAIGTTPGGEEIQPFMTSGIMHDESETGVPGSGLATRGVAHTSVALVSGQTYYSTVRGITNAGAVLQSTSNGFTVDDTPPDVQFISYAQETTTANLAEGSVLYRGQTDALSADWEFSDTLSSVTNLTYRMGSFPGGDDFVVDTDVNSNEVLVGEAALPANLITPENDGRSNIMKVVVADEVGLTATAISASMVIDTTAPIQGSLSCPSYIQSHNPIDCTWTGFHDAESPIVSFDFEITVGESLSSIHTASLAGTVTAYVTPSLTGTVKHGYTYFAIVTATNELGLSSSVTSDPIRIDATPPVAGTVVEISSSYEIYFNDSSATDNSNAFSCDSADNCTTIDATCQESLTSVYVAWSPFEDTETDIARYQIAVGTSAGGGQIKAFFDVPVNRRYYQVKGLDLNGQRQIFVSVKGFNGAGMATVSTSNGVYISYISQGITPPSPFSVWDQDSTDGDIDYQTSRTTITARWDVSGDPCPVLKYEWAIERIDGVRVQEFYDTNGQSYGLNDDLALIGVETYYQLLRVTTSMNNFTYTLRSDGVTIIDQPLYPGYVYDGDVTDIDLQYQPFRNKVSANWGGFGEKNEVTNNSIQVISGNAGVMRQERPPNQEIVRYEVAVGTDRRFEKTRDDIVAWQDVGMNTSATFYDLDLVPEVAIYYVTVRAYSAANTMSEVTSNGFSVGFDTGVTGGTILIGQYVNASTTLPVKWQEFESDVEMMIYYVALSSASVPVLDCDHVMEGGPMLEADRLAIFDIVDRTNVGDNTYTELTGLSLTQDTDYWLSVIGVDEAGKCKIVTNQIHIDTTAPDEGNLRSGPYYDMAMSFTPYPRAIHVYWENYTDVESGLQTVKLDLYQKMSCSVNETDPDVLVRSVTIDGAYSDFKFLDLDISASTPYYVVMTVVNNADLKVTTQSPVIVLDTSTNTAGSVVDGTNILSDLAWAGSQTELKATVLYLPVSSGSYCPPQSLLNSDVSWNTLESSINNDQTGRVLDLLVRDANVQRSSLRTDEFTIKLAIDTSTGVMNSGDLYRNADLALGGRYEMDIMAASGDGQAVTSVTFWDGPEDYLTHYDYTAPDTTPYCDCCNDAVPTNTCETVCGGCTSYLSNNLVSGKRKRRSINQVMQLTAAQRLSLSSSGNMNSISPSVSTNPSQPACGMQLYKNGQTGRLVLWCTFSSTSAYEPRIEDFELDFDPSSSFHHYTIDMYTVADEAANPTWCLAVAIDDSEESNVNLCGLPDLSSNTTLHFSVWNWKNFVPSVNVTSVFATLWNAEAVIRNIVVPASQDNVCRYKVPFRGADHGIVAFEAGIGSDELQDNIVPFQRVHDTCVPCVDECNRYHCDSACSDSTISTITLTLSGLNLPINHTDSDGNEKAKTYYYTVRAMLASGESAVASSDGFNIDVSPPEFDDSVFNYLDPSHEDEIRPAYKYWGSDSTMQATWKCTDAESDVVEYRWAIGTSSGGIDIQDFTSTGFVNEGSNANLTGILTDGVKYYVSVECTNGAGLTAFYNDTSGITVTLTPPDLSGVNVGLVSMSTISGNTIPATARRMSTQNSFSLDFTVDPDPDIDEYYFKICSQDTQCDDIFQRTLVSNRQSGRLTISNGRLYKDGQQMFELQQVKSDYNATLASATNSDSFHVELGRQLFPYIDGCNEAQCNSKSFGAIVVMNGQSQSATSTAGESITMSLGVSGGVGKKKRSTSAIDVITPTGMAVGQSIVMASLTDSDMTDSYDSAASSGFVSYITSPADTTTNSDYMDRILYDRVNYNSATDVSFTLTSVGDIEMPGVLTIDYPYDPSDNVNTWMILHWNPSSEEWQFSHETCIDETDTYIENANTITIKVCNTRGNETHNSTYTYFREETQFLLTDVEDAIPNTAPVLDSSVTNSLDEDSGTLVYQLIASDGEGDAVSFVMDDSVTFAQMDGDIQLSTSGLLLFTPCDDCHGDFKKVINLYEEPVTGITALTSTYTMTITVNDINDPPVAFAFMDGVDLLAADPTEPVEVLLEEKRFNTTDNTNYTFIFGAYDNDGPDDILTVMLSNPVNGTLTVVSASTSTPSCSSSEIPCSSMSLTHSASDLGWTYVTYNYVPNDDHWGIDPAQIYVKDEDNALTSVITMNFSVMAQPCENDGECAAPENATYTCENVYRAISFDTYYICNCTDGFEGTYCEDDLDECATNPCKWPYVCEDGANGFTCKCPDDNPECDGIEGWMIGIIVVGVLLLILLVLLMWYMFILKRGRLVWGNLFKGNKYRRSSLDSGRDSPRDNGFNFDNKNYMIEKEDQDGFNSIFNTMMSPAPGEEVAEPSRKSSLPSLPTTGLPIAAGAAPVSTGMMQRTNSTVGASSLASEQTTPPTARRGSYIPRNTSSTSLHKSNIARRSSTSSWLNTLLNNSDVDPETPRTSRPITPVEHPVEEEEDDRDDALFFFS